MSSLLNIEKITVKTEGNTILDLPDLTVNSGEVLVFLGPNGAGKSTLLQVAAGLRKPSTGKVYFAKYPDLSDLAYRRKISTVFQSPLLLSDTVENNIACGLQFRGFSNKEIKDRVLKWMDLLHISKLAKRRARILSGGEAQRVSLARAFCLQTEVIMMDEPLSALDAPTRQELINDLREIFSETNQTCMYVTHDLEEGLTLADRIAVLFNGKLHQLDKAQEVFSHPSTPAVAAFMGVENIIAGCVVNNNQGLLQIEAGNSIIEAAGDQRVGAEVFICLRPEDVTLFSSSDAIHSSTARNRVKCVITQLSHQGPFIRVQLAAGYKLIALVTRPSAEEMGLAVGKEYFATFKATAIHLLPSGRKA